MNHRVICHNARPTSRHAERNLPRAKVSHPACPECGTPVTTLKRERDERGLSYRVVCANCCRVLLASLRITNDLKPTLSRPAPFTPKAHDYLACTYCGSSLRTYSGRRATDYSTERYMRCTHCHHAFKAVYEFSSQARPDPDCRIQRDTPLKTEYIRYGPYQQFELGLTA